jgi:MobA/VirD2-like, nuclease domain
MNIKGRARGAPRDLAGHLRKEENEAVWIIGIHELVGQDIDGALLEMDALGAGLKTSKTLYHMQISPAPTDPAMTPEQIDYAVAVALEKLELGQQPHIVVGHRKAGKDGIEREHYHVVASRTDLEHNRAISDSHNYLKHELAAREIERTLGHERVQGAHAERFGTERPERTPTAAEMRQAERGAVPAKEAKALGAEIWQSTDSGKAISAALESHGWQLARGDKERKDGGAYFMAVDPHGHAHELRRMVPVKAAALYERMADIDPAMLPSVKETKQQVRAAEQEKHGGAERQELRPDDPSRDFSRAAATATEPAQKATETRKHGRAADVPEHTTPVLTAPQIRAPPLFRRLARSLTSRTRSLWRGAAAAITRGLAQATELPRRPVADVGWLGDGEARRPTT